MQEGVGFSICEVLGNSVLKLSSSESVSDDERKTSAASDAVGESSGNGSCRGRLNG